LGFAQLYTVWRLLLVEQSRLLTSDGACVVFRLRLRRTSRGLPPPTAARLPHLSILHCDHRNST